MAELFGLRSYEPDSEPEDWNCKFVEILLIKLKKHLYIFIFTCLYILCYTLLFLSILYLYYFVHFTEDGSDGGGSSDSGGGDRDGGGSGDGGIFPRLPFPIPRLRVHPPRTPRPPLVTWIKILLIYLLVAFIFNCFSSF